MEQIKKWIALTKKKRELDRDLKEVTAQLEELEGGIVDYMTEEGVDKLTLDGMTVYLQEVPSVTAKEEYRYAVCKMIFDRCDADNEFTGLENMVNVNSRSITGHFKELLRNEMVTNKLATLDSVIPADLLPMLNVNTVMKIRGRTVSK